MKEKKQRLRDGNSEMPAADAAGRGSEGSPSPSAGSQPSLLGCLKEEVENRSCRKKRPPRTD